MIPVERADDPRLADFSNGGGTGRRRDVERAAAEAGVLVCEGPLLVRRLLGSGLAVRAVAVSDKQARVLAEPLAACGAPVYVAPDDVLADLTGYAFHRGALASAARPAAQDWRAVAARASRLAVVEDVVEQENVGSIFRNAAAFGCDGVLLSPWCCDPLWRRAIRVSVGHALTLPHARLTPWPSALGELQALGFELAALTGAGSITLDAWLPGERVALLVGSEGPGLGEDALAHADVRVRIPMAPDADSLNVAAASAVALRHVADPSRLF